MYKGNVYNLSVWKDESYITKIGITHNCRCDVIQTAEDASDNIPDIDPSIKPEFEMNIGKSGQVFKEDGDKHGFFALAEKGKDWKKRFELSKLEGGFNKVISPKGNLVKVSIYADDADLRDNFNSAVKASDHLGLKYEIRPDLKNGWKNPEYKIDGLIADRYEGNIQTGLAIKRKQIKEFIKQHNNQYPSRKINTDYAIHFDISNVTITYDLARYIYGKFKAGKSLKIVVIEKDYKIIKLSSSDNYQDIVKMTNYLKATKD